jgi:hypothetical protein
MPTSTPALVILLIRSKSPAPKNKRYEAIFGVVRKVTFFSPLPAGASLATGMLLTASCAGNDDREVESCPVRGFIEHRGELARIARLELGEERAVGLPSLPV